VVKDFASPIPVLAPLRAAEADVVAVAADGSLAGIRVDVGDLGCTWS